MKLDFIKQLMSEFDQSNVTKMKVEIDDLKIELEKESEKVEYVKPVEKEKEVIEDQQIKQEQATGTAVKSPIVGVFYSASSPESEPYVTVGKNVKTGDIVCIIEAMKVMNEIKAPCDGTVTSILVENEALVEYDQALMVIEENV